MTPKVGQATQTQEVNLQSKFKAGKLKTSCQNEMEKSIFNSLDKNHNGKLESSEVENIVTGKIKNKQGKFIEKQYVKIKDLENGRSLVRGSDGTEHVMSHDGIILKKSYVENKTNQGQNFVFELNKKIKTATKEFNKQLKDDGWAGDVADGFSKIWNNKLGEKIGISTGNTADHIRKELAEQQQNLNELTKAANKSKAAFETKFEEIYGVKYNQKAIDNYRKNPTPENYKKAFGDKVPDITARVDEYKQSQQTGATAVKTTAKVGAGVVVGVATGGTGLVALGIAAGATATASVIVDETDRANVTGSYTDASGNKVETKGAFKEGTNHGKILTDAAWDGASVLAGGAVGKVANTVVRGATKASQVGKAAINVAGDTGMGAAREYAETGEITAEGVISNAVTSGVGSAVTSGATKAVGKFIGKSKGSSNTNTNTNTTTTTSNNNTASNTTNTNGQNSSNVAGPGRPTSDASLEIVNKKGTSSESKTPAKSQSSDAKQETTTNLTKKTYEKPTMKKNEVGVKDDIMAAPIKRPKIAIAEYRIKEGCSAGSGNEFSLKLNEVNGKKIVNIKNVGAKPRNIEVKPNMSETIGTDASGRSVILNADNRGMTFISYGEKPTGFLSKMKNSFGISQYKPTSGDIPVYAQTSQPNGGIEIVAKKTSSVNKTSIGSQSSRVGHETKVGVRQTTDNTAHNGSTISTKLQTRQYKQNNVSENRAAYRQMAREGKSLVKTIPNNADISNISSYVTNGDVCNLNGKLYVNDNGNPVQLKMSQKTFERLFNPTELGNTYQPGKTHTCPVISTINSSMAVPTGRATIYQMFEETTEGIKINFKNNTSVTFNSGNAIDEPLAKMGSTGLDMLEQGILLTHSSNTSPVYKKLNVNEYVDNTPAIKLNRRVQHPEDYNASMHPEKLIYGSQFNKMSPTTEQEIVDLVKNFDFNNSVMTYQTFGHQISITGYNPVTKTLTIHDQMAGAFKDSEIPLSNFIGTNIRYSKF